jgi:esterase/lipase
MVLFREASQSKINCLFLPGIPGHVKNFDIFDDLIENSTSIYFHTYPGTNNTSGIFSIDSAVQSIYSSLDSLETKSEPILIIAYSFSTYLIMQLNLSKYKNIVGLLLLSPVTGLDQKSISEDFLKSLIYLEDKGDVVIDKEEWKDTLQYCRFKSITETLEKLSRIQIPICIAYSKNDEIINFHIIEKELKIFMDENGYGSFLVVASPIGNHRIDSYYNIHIKNIISIFRIQEDLKDMLGHDISIYYYGSSQFPVFSSPKSDIDLLIIADNYMDKYSVINEYLNQQNNDGGTKIDLSLNERSDFYTKKNARYNRGPVLLHTINELYFPIKHLNEKIVPNPDDVLHDTYQANLINLRDAEKKVCRVGKDANNARKIVKFFVNSVLYLLYSRGHQNIDMSNMSRYLSNVEDAEIIKQLKIATLLLSSAEPEYRLEQLHEFVMRIKSIVGEQERRLNITYEIYPTEQQQFGF